MRVKFILGHKPYVRFLVACDLPHKFSGPHKGSRRDRLLATLQYQMDCHSRRWLAIIPGGTEMAFDSEFRAASWLRRQFSCNLQ